MKIIHFADTHIGVETYGSLDPVSGLSTRVLDELRAMDEVIDFAIENRVDLVLFCGDAYKNREPSQTHQREFARRIRRLSEAKIHTVIVVGNHDLPGSQGKANSVDIFNTLKVDYIHIATKPEVINIQTGDEVVQVAAFPWLRRNALLVRDDVKNLSVDRVIERLQEAMAARLADLADAIDTSRPAVLAAHVAVSNAKTGTERSMVIGNDPVVLLSTIANPVYDYVALGHVHKGQVLCEAPPVVYSGSLERLDFSDEDEDKGFYLIEIEGKECNRSMKYEFRKIEARRFLTIEMEVTDTDIDPTTSVLTKIKEKANEVMGAVVRLKLSLPGHLANVMREGEIFKALKEAYNVSIAKELRRTVRSRASDWIRETLTPLEALQNYLETMNVPMERRKKLLEYGEKLINEKLSVDGGTYAV